MFTNWLRSIGVLKSKPRPEWFDKLDIVVFDSVEPIKPSGVSGLKIQPSEHEATNAVIRTYQNPLPRKWQILNTLLPPRWRRHPTTLTVCGPDLPAEGTTASEAFRQLYPDDPKSQRIAEQVYHRSSPEQIKVFNVERVSSIPESGFSEVLDDILNRYNTPQAFYHTTTITKERE